MLGGQCRENSSAYPKIGLAHVRAFLGTLQAQCDAAKVVGGHGLFMVLPSAHRRGGVRYLIGGVCFPVLGLRYSGGYGIQCRKTDYRFRFWIWWGCILVRLRAAELHGRPIWHITSNNGDISGTGWPSITRSKGWCARRLRF